MPNEPFLLWLSVLASMFPTKQKRLRLNSLLFLFDAFFFNMLLLLLLFFSLDFINNAKTVVVLLCRMRVSFHQNDACCFVHQNVVHLFVHIRCLVVLLLLHSFFLSFFCCCCFYMPFIFLTLHHRL